MRYKIWEYYFGKFEQTYVVGGSDELSNAFMIVTALVKKFEGRPFAFKAELCAPKDDLFDSEFSFFDDDYSSCLDWNYCLGGGK